MDIWGVTNKAVINIRVQTFVWTCTFISFGYWPRSGTDESDFRDMFDFLKNCQTVFQSNLTILHYHASPSTHLPAAGVVILSTSAAVMGV